MRLLLVNPEIDFTSLNPRLDAFLKKCVVPVIRKNPSLPLLVVAGLTPPDIEVVYADEHVRKITGDEPADLVGIGCMTPQAARACEIADVFRRRGTPVVLGGVHPTVLPREAKGHADAVVVGEAEGVWKGVIRDFRRGKLKDFYRGRMCDLASSPLPRYDLLTPDDFAGMPRAMVPVQFTRGCPRNCSFCNIPKICGRRQRIKKVKQMIAEIMAAIASCRMPDAMIKLSDANPFVSRIKAMAISEAFSNAPVPWVSLADISIARHPDILAKLRRSGCFMLAIGFESVETGVLERVSPWKRSYQRSYADAVRIIGDHGIAVAGNFMLGFGRHSRDDLQRILDFAIENRIMSQFTIATPFPGTRFYDELEAEGRIKKEIDWRFYNAFNVVYETLMNADEIAEDICWLYEKMTAPDVVEEINRFNAAIIGRTHGEANG